MDGFEFSLHLYRLPSFTEAFTATVPLTRIRDIAHRGDIPHDIKQEIKHTIQVTFKGTYEGRPWGLGHWKAMDMSRSIRIYIRFAPLKGFQDLIFA